MSRWAKIYLGAAWAFVAASLLAWGLEWPPFFRQWFAASAIWSLVSFFIEDWDR